MAPTCGNGVVYDVERFLSTAAPKSSRDTARIEDGEPRPVWTFVDGLDLGPGSPHFFGLIPAFAAKKPFISPSRSSSVRYSSALNPSGRPSARAAISNSSTTDSWIL